MIHTTISDKSEQYRLKMMLHMCKSQAMAQRKRGKRYSERILYVRAHCNYCSFCALIYLAHGFLIWFFSAFANAVDASFMHACDAHCTPKIILVLTFSSRSVLNFSFSLIFPLPIDNILYRRRFFWVVLCVSVYLHANAQSNVFIFWSILHRWQNV